MGKKSIFFWKIHIFRISSFTMKKFLLFLKKEHPRSILSYDHGRVTILFFSLVFFLLIFFKPYILADYSIKVRFLVVMCYTLIACIGLWIGRFLSTPYQTKKWTRLNQVVHVFNVIIISWLLGSLFTVFMLDNLIEYVFGPHHSAMIPPSFFLFSFLYVFVFGVVIYVFLRLYDLTYLFRRPNAFSNKVSHIDTTAIGASDNIKLKGKNKGEFIEIQQKKLLYIKAEGHYAQVYYLNAENNLETKLLRSSIKEIENSIKFIDNIYRSHRSYIVNIDYVQSIIPHEHKSYGYLKNDLGKISVSKDNVAILKKRINA